MSTFDPANGTALLRRTPAALDAWLREAPACWLESDEGPNTWTPLVVLGHLIEGERHDWLPRVRHLLAHGETVPFAPFDRFSQLQGPKRTVGELLDEFAECRETSLAELAVLGLQADDLNRTGRHPEFGVVTLGQHLATWVTHDLNHIAQIARVMAHSLSDAVGPWRAYLRVLHDRR